MFFATIYPLHKLTPFAECMKSFNEHLASLGEFNIKFHKVDLKCHWKLAGSS